MLQESGRVIAVDDEGLWVETIQRSACGQCRAKHGCGQRLLASHDSQYTCVKVAFPANYRSRPDIGDEVSIGIEEHAFLSGVLISYGLPLLFMLFALLLASSFSNHEITYVLSAFGGLLIGGLIVRRFAQTLPGAHCLQAVLISVDTPRIKPSEP